MGVLPDDVEDVCMVATYQPLRLVFFYTVGSYLAALAKLKVGIP
jgi:hypothetical protein